MESESFEGISKVFREINIDDEPNSGKQKKWSKNLWAYSDNPKPKLPRIQPPHIDFEEYVKNNYKNKFQVLNRDTFYHIQKPIVIFFNHFREKCVYHIQWLDRIYELALIYSERIVFIAADIFYMGILYPESNPFHLFDVHDRSINTSPYIYAINEKKLIYQHYDSFKTLKTLSVLCENLLKGDLFPSLPIPENNDKKLVKICVHHNYKELILKSTKNIFLIINRDKYQYTDREPNYDNVALALKDYNLDIVYMEAQKNYIPFEYHVFGYPTILFIPHNDEQDFVYYNGMRNEAEIINYLKNILENPDFLCKQQQKLRSDRLGRPVKVPHDFQIEFKDLSAFVANNFNKRFQILDRKLLEKAKRTVIIVFMDFQGKCLQRHIQWLNRIYQLAATAWSFLYFIADYADIDVINTRWQPKDLIKAAQGKPKIFALDHLKHTYEFGNFDSITKLYYFTESVQSGDFYYTQLQTTNYFQQLVKVWTANKTHIFLRKSKKTNLFLTFYSSKDVKSEKLSNLLEWLALDVKQLNVDMVKFDVQWNYVDLEFAQPVYPAQYFIPKGNKRESILYNGNYLDREEILEFIKNNII